MTKITKEDLSGRGIEIPEKKKRYTLKHSWHVPEKVKFATEADTNETDIDTKKKIKKGDFISIGHREIEPDDPIRVEGSDIVHWNAAFEGTLGEALKKYGGKDIRKVEGFSELTEEQKLKYLKEADQATAEELKKLEKPKQAFTGVNAVLAGGFENKDEVAKKIEDNGGKVISNVTKACNLLVLGRSWTTKTRTKVGKGSPKHREAVKKGAKIVKRKWLEKAIEAFKKTGKTALEQEAPKQEEMDVESEEERDVHDKKEKEAKRKREEASGKSEEEPAAKKQKKAIEVDKLEKMKRGELQSLCKDHGIKASGTNDEMIKKLKEAAGTK